MILHFQSSGIIREHEISLDTCFFKEMNHENGQFGWVQGFMLSSTGHYELFVYFPCCI